MVDEKRFGAMEGGRTKLKLPDYTAPYRYITQYGAMDEMISALDHALYSGAAFSAMGFLDAFDTGSSGFAYTINTYTGVITGGGSSTYYGQTGWGNPVVGQQPPSVIIAPFGFSFGSTTSISGSAPTVDQATGLITVPAHSFISGVFNWWMWLAVSGGGPLVP